MLELDDFFTCPSSPLGLPELDNLNLSEEQLES